MSTWYSLAVDCGQNRIVAEELVSYFCRFEVRWEDLSRPPIPCKANQIFIREAEQPDHSADEWILVSIRPNDLYLQSSKSDLLRPDMLSIITDKLYRPLRTFSGFRAAWFGQNADTNLGSLDWPRRFREMLDGVFHPTDGMVISKDLISRASLHSQFIEFSDDLLIYRRLLPKLFRDSASNRKISE